MPICPGIKMWCPDATMEFTDVQVEVEEEESGNDEYSIKQCFACHTSDFNLLVAFCQTLLLCLAQPPPIVGSLLVNVR